MSKVQIACILCSLLLCLASGDKRPTPRYPPRYPPPPSHPGHPQQPSYPPPPPKHPSYPQPSHPKSYRPYPKYQEVCKLKEWSSDTELCTPGLAQSCEQMKASVYKISKPKPKCIEITIPKCKTTNDAEEIDICTMKVKTEEQDLQAKVYGQEMKKKCNTHYTTECKPGYGGYNPAPYCVSVPAQICYDVPVLKKKDVPIRIKVTVVESECKTELVPTPKTKCWDETKEFCIDIPELKEKDEHLNKCAITVSEDDCRKVRLTIPREFCFHVQNYGPQVYQSHYRG